MTEPTASNGKNGHGQLPASMLASLKPGPGLIAPLTLDLESYIDDFNTTVIDAYRRGVADVELPADAGVARSLIGPGTAGIRDFSSLSPLIPRFVADQCVGCMACVSACPDSAIMATAQPKSSLATALDEFAATQPDPALAAETAKAHFVHTTKYADVPAKKRSSSRRTSASSSIRTTARAAPSAWTCAWPRATRLWSWKRRATAKPAASRPSSATAATSPSSSRCRPLRSSIATRRCWPI